MRIVTIGLDDLESALPFSELLTSVEEGLDIAAAEIKDKFLEPTASWSHKPDFQVAKVPLQREIATSDLNYVRVNNGTRPHLIRKKNRALRFSKDFSAKTVPFNFMGLEGSRGGEVVYASAVHHPGVEPRGWDELIEYLYGDFSGGGRLALILQNAIDRHS